LALGSPFFRFWRIKSSFLTSSWISALISLLGSSRRTSFRRSLALETFWTLIKVRFRAFAFFWALDWRNWSSSGRSDILKGDELGSLVPIGVLGVLGVVIGAFFLLEG
ncbi:hypothetical protein T310_5735, partial [Rasamsonia emersonii CBS 393.64]